MKHQTLNPRISMVTLGVRDLKKATAFYTQVFGVKPHGKSEGVAFFTLRGTWLSLYPLHSFAKDIGQKKKALKRGFSGIALAQNVRTRKEVALLLVRAKKAGGKIVKPAHDTFWDGHDGFFADLDGHLWEIAWAPMFKFAKDGSLIAPK